VPAEPLEISVAVATRQRPQRLSRLLDSLEQQSVSGNSFEVVVTVDGADDATEALLSERSVKAAMPISVAVLDVSHGPAAARNVAWRRAKAPLIAFTDDDCEASPGWLKAILDAARRCPGVIIQGPTHPNPADAYKAGPFSRTMSILEATDEYQTCNITYPREVLESVGGFDEEFTEAYGEDADLGWRAAATGARMTYEPEAIVLHAIEDLGPLGFLQQARRGKSAALVFRRHPELRRRATFARIFWTRTHAVLVAAIFAVALGQRHRTSYILALPYAKSVFGRARTKRAHGLYFAPYLIVWDLTHLSTGLRGSIRHRTIII
jgi:GT2 family glycosyltransferase